ncbi:uncharacterized protein LOC117569570 [Drosophila albomicans]|uniref:Uncharacterized protein LOC117569570 n=1 Tax=Drosophila albomicans TaxID=7291 RepID=A0A6P8WYH4_DROAB|nr:uncharacterized protein LOC117569570 [Drosophila albomicans]
MRPYQVACIVVASLLLLQPASIEAKRRKHKGNDHHDSHRSKTKTKWSTSSDLSGPNSQVSTEEHGYYVKRTFSPLAAKEGKTRQSPPYLAIPIAWFSCEAGKAGCQQLSNSGSINSPAHALSEGYLCDDDCAEELYEPICGKTPNEIAVFYNKCKLNVAKCRTHGLWTELPYEECQKTYPKETAYTEKKFRCSPYFRDAATVAAEAEKEKEKDKDKDSNESSEEQKEDKKKHKQKVEKVEPIALPLEVKPVTMPVPSPVVVPVPNPVAVPVLLAPEAVALPPIPVKKTAETLAQIVAKPLAIQNQAIKAPVAAVAKPLESEKDKLKYVVS